MGAVVGVVGAVGALVVVVGEVSLGWWGEQASTSEEGSA